jgi:predicted phosphatase
MNTLQICIIYYTVAVSVDRYLYISLGLQTNLYCTVRNALRIIICLTIFAIIFIIPYWFKFRVITQIDIENRTRYKMTCK